MATKGLLNFQQDILENAISQDGLHILAPGLGVLQIVGVLVRLQDERRKHSGEEGVTLIVGATLQQRLALQKEMELTYPKQDRYGQNTDESFPFEVTAELPTAERLRQYASQSCLFVTTRILVVDLLSGRLDPSAVSGILVLNAHRVTESSGEGFVVRLYRTKGGKGYLRAFTEHPVSFTNEFAKLEKVMKALHVQSVQIWPRFRTAVQDDFEGKSPELVEVSLPADPGAGIVYEALSELIDISVKELRKHEKLDTTDLTPSKGLISAFDENIKRQLAPVWHTVSPKIRQIVSDIRTLRSLANYLLKFDAVTFLKYLENLKMTEGAKSAWMFHSAAHIVFEAAKNRVYTLEEHKNGNGQKSPHDAHTSPEISPVLEFLPKWKALIEILNEIMDEGHDKPVLVYCQDEFTCGQLKRVIKPYGPDEFMQSQYVDYLASKAEKKGPKIGRKRNAYGTTIPGTLAPHSQIEESALHKEARSLGAVKKSKLKSKKHSSNVELPPSTDAAVQQPKDPITAWFEDKVKYLTADVCGSQSLWEDKPIRIVMYDPDISLTRQLELYTAQHADLHVRIYLLRYEPSPEMDKYQTSLARERACFEDLIRAKGSMARNITWDSDKSYLPIVRADNSMSANDITRKAGGRQLLEAGVKVRVIVDVREFMSPFPAVLHYQGYQIVPVTLEVGDYILSPEICVERKSIPDLRGSLASGRLYQQAEAMCKHYPIAILLIEFDGDRAFALQSTSELGDDIQSSHIMSRLALLCLHHPRLRLVWSRSLHATADIFRQLKANHDEPDPIVAGNVGLQDTTGNEPAINTTALEVLRKMPGVTETNARGLAREAGSLAGLIQISLERLEIIMESKPSARRLHDFLHADDPSNSK